MKLCFMPTTFLFVIAGADALAQSPAAELNLDFRNGRFRETVLSYYGKDAQQYLTPDAAGLRISIPRADRPPPAVGISSKLAVQGDFEITLSYEILQAEVPNAGNGVGVVLAIFAASPTRDSATLARRVHPSKGDVFTTNRSFRTPEREDKQAVEFFPALARRGKLRLARTGTTLVYSHLSLAPLEGGIGGEEQAPIASGLPTAAIDKDGFQEIRREDFVEAPLKTVRVTAEAAHEAGDVEILIHSLQIRGRTLSASLETDIGHASWWLWLTLALMGLGAVALVFYLTKRRFAA